MFLIKDIKAKESSDKPLILAQVDRKPAETVAGVPTLESSAQPRILHVTTSKNVHEIEATNAGASESVPDPSQSSCDHMFFLPFWGVN